MFNPKTYFDIVNPKTSRDTIEREAKKEDSELTLINVIALVAISSLYVGFPGKNPADLLGDLPPGMDTSSFAYKLMTFNPFGSIPSIILTFIVALASFYLYLAIAHFAAGLLGGKGKFSQLAYVFSMQSLMISIIMLPLNIITIMVPIVSCLGGIAALAFSGYGAYLGYKIIRVVYPQLSRLTGIVVFAVYFVSAIVVSSIVLVARAMAGI